MNIAGSKGTGALAGLASLPGLTPPHGWNVEPVSVGLVAMDTSWNTPIPHDLWEGFINIHPQRADCELPCCTNVI